MGLAAAAPLAHAHAQQSLSLDERMRSAGERGGGTGRWTLTSVRGTEGKQRVLCGQLSTAR